MNVFKNPIIFSLDVSSVSEAEYWIERLGSKVGCIKLGPRLLLRTSPDWVRSVAKVAPVFVDMKFYDIPSTMVAAIESAFEMGATIATVHSLVGLSTLKQLSILEQQLSQERSFYIAPVTILTSQESSDLPLGLDQYPTEDLVQQLAHLVQQAGLRSLICSPHEAFKVRQLSLWPITPGVRFDSSPAQPREDWQDQKRVMTPAQALQAGAAALVIGRSLLQSPNPQLTLQAILDSLNPYENAQKS